SQPSFEPSPGIGGGGRISRTDRLPRGGGRARYGRVAGGWGRGVTLVGRGPRPRRHDTRPSTGSRRRVRRGGGRRVPGAPPLRGGRGGGRGPGAGGLRGDVPALGGLRPRPAAAPLAAGDRVPGGARSPQAAAPRAGGGRRGSPGRIDRSGAAA